MASTVLSRWKARLSARLQLLKAARRRHEAHPTSATRKVLEHRKSQVHEAERVIARHLPHHAERISQRGTEFIATFEGGQSRDGLFHPYRDAVGVWTIGYGHTEGVGPHSQPLTKKQAQRLLAADVDRKYGAAVRALRLPLKQGQFDALTSLAYNLGPGVLSANTTIGAALRRHDWKAAADAFLLYDHAGGHRLPGLTRRRQAERRMFLDA